MLKVNRRFSLPETFGLKPLSDFFAKHCVVILGEPGLGKTTSFQMASELEPNAMLLTIGQFLNYPLHRIEGNTLYLDGLDEHRGKSDGQDTIEVIVGRLMELGEPKVRVSCRTLDWHGEHDLTTLKEISGGEEVCTLNLEPLNTADIIAIVRDQIEDPDTFMIGSRQHGVDDLFTNPQSLELYLTVYKETGGWPNTRMELFDKATALQLQERNVRHARALAPISNEELMHAAEDLAAVFLLANIEGFTTLDINNDIRMPSIESLTKMNVQAMKAVVERRLFAHPEPDIITFGHRTITEFLASKAISRRVQEGRLPFQRVVTMITGIDGGTLSDLRGVYAWLIALLPAYSRELVATDPIGALAYGDAKQWENDTKYAALAALKQLSVRDPYFRANFWEPHPLGALACEELSADFKEIILNNESAHLVSVVLDAIEHGSSLPELGDVLLNFIRDIEAPHFLKDNAVRAFVSACAERRVELVAILDQAMTGVIADEDLSLQAELAKQLYPEFIAPKRMVELLNSCDEEASTSSFDWFAGHELVKLTPDENLIPLADALLENSLSQDTQHSFYWGRLNGGLLLRLLEVFKDTATPEQMYNWLGLAVDKHFHPKLDRNDVAPIQSHIQNRPELYMDMFRFWLGSPTKDGNWWWAYQGFQNRLLMVDSPSDFPQQLLGLAQLEQGSIKGEFLFTLATRLILDPNSISPPAWLDELFAFVESNPVFQGLWVILRVSNIDDWRWEDIRRKKEGSTKRSEEQEANIEILMKQLEGLRNGDAIQNLNHASKIWFKMFTNIDDTENPVERLRIETNDEITLAVLSGFKCLINNVEQHTPDEITKLEHESRCFWEAYPTLAGADLIASHSHDEFMLLPDKNLKAVLAYRLVNHLGGKLHPWHEWIYTERSDLAEEVLEEIWRTGIEAGRERLEHLHVYSVDEVIAPIAAQVAFRILNDFPALSHGLLETLIVVILNFGDKSELPALAEKALEGSELDPIQRTMWLTVGFIIDYPAYAAELTTVSGDDERWACYDILLPGMKRFRSQNVGIMSVFHIRNAIEIFCRLFESVPMPLGSRTTGSHDLPEASQNIHALIQSLSNIPTSEASSALSELCELELPVGWNNSLRHSREEQLKKRRESEFDYPNVEKVCSLLSNGAPTGMADLLTVVVGALDEMAKEIRDGNTDSWKAFWNTDQYERPLKQKVENQCRDRLLDLLRPKLIPYEVRYVEPEGHFAEDKRADIAVYHSVGKLPIEIKRDSHIDIWTAQEDQLERLYSRDPESEGYGIYIVFWFGEDNFKKPSRELNIEMPTSAAELQYALEGLRSQEAQHRIEVRVIDVSKPR